MRFDGIESFRHRAKGLPRAAHLVHRLVGPLLSVRPSGYGCLKMILQKFQILLREIPSVVHGGPKEALGADDIKQSANDSLLCCFR